MVKSVIAMALWFFLMITVLIPLASYVTPKVIDWVETEVIRGYAQEYIVGTYIPAMRDLVQGAAQEVSEIDFPWETTSEPIPAFASPPTNQNGEVSGTCLRVTAQPTANIRADHNLQANVVGTAQTGSYLFYGGIFEDGDFNWFQVGEGWIRSDTVERCS